VTGFHFYTVELLLLYYKVSLPTMKMCFEKDTKSSDMDTGHDIQCRLDIEQAVRAKATQLKRGQTEFTCRHAMLHHNV